MLYFLKGITAALEPGLAVIECAGVGYACHLIYPPVRPGGRH